MQPLQLVGTSQGAKWFIPKAVVDTRNDELTAAYRSVTDEGGMVLSLAMNASKGLEGGVDSSVSPAWRKAVMLGFVAQWAFAKDWSWHILTLLGQSTSLDRGQTCSLFKTR